MKGMHNLELKIKYNIWTLHYNYRMGGYGQNINL